MPRRDGLGLYWRRRAGPRSLDGNTYSAKEHEPAYTAPPPRTLRLCPSSFHPFPPLSLPTAPHLRLHLLLLMDVVTTTPPPPAPPADAVVPTAVPPPGTDGRRRDGRAPTAARPPTIELAWHATADGSCRWTVGATTVTAAVIGPADCPPARQVPDAATLAVTVRSAAAGAATPGGRLVASVRAGGGAVEAVGGGGGGVSADPAGTPGWDAVVADRAAEGRLAAALQTVVRLSAHPRAAISVAVHVVTSGGGGWRRRCSTRRPPRSSTRGYPCGGCWRRGAWRRAPAPPPWTLSIAMAAAAGCG